MAIPKPSKSKSKMSKPKIPEIPVAPKQFKIEPWGVNDGQRIIIYGDTGLGKTTLASMCGKVAFIGLDEGGGEIQHPITGEPLERVPGIQTFEDVRAALQSHSLYEDYDTVVIDHITLLQDLAEDYVVRTVTTDKGASVRNILSYGYNKGYKHLYNTMKLVLSDCDELARRGKNVILIAQSALLNVPNPGGEDFIRNGLRLHVDKTWNIESLYCEWANHVLRIAYHDAFVKNKKASGSTERAVFVQPELYFMAKSRTIEEPVVSFSHKADSSIWDFMFGASDEQS